MSPMYSPAISAVRESRVILVLCPNFTNPFYGNIVTGIADTARRHGYSAMFCTTQSDKEREKDFLDMLRNKRADCAILLATENSPKFLSHLAEQYPHCPVPRVFSGC